MNRWNPLLTRQLFVELSGFIDFPPNGEGPPAAESPLGIYANMHTGIYGLLLTIAEPTCKPRTASTLINWEHACKLGRAGYKKPALLGGITTVCSCEVPGDSEGLREAPGTPGSP